VNQTWSKTNQRKQIKHMKPQIQKIISALALLALLTLNLQPSTACAQGTTITLTSTADSGPGSLRAAVAGASNGDTIVFANTLSGQTIALTSGEIVVSNRLTIDGSALANGIQISGSNLSRIFNIGSSGNLTLDSLTLRDANGGGGDGGAILNVGTAVLNGCTLTANSTGSGGAIVNNSPGHMALNNCTLTGNSSAPLGGGGAIVNRASLSINNCTLANNTSNNGGSIYNDSTGVLDLTNSIVTGPNSSIVQLGTLNGSSNLVDTANINLAPLGNYGGPTQTLPPLPGSPAIDAGDDAAASAFSTDQRGYPRVAGAHVDIGAVEAGDAIPGYDYTVVTTTNDFLNGLGADGVSLRDAVAFATNNSTITFAPDLAGQTTMLTNGQIVLATNLTIDASVLPGGVQINAYTGNGTIYSRVFQVNSNVVAALNSLTIAKGLEESPNLGGGILNYGTLTLHNCSVTENFDVDAGGEGICNDSGILVLNHCSLSGNGSSSDSSALIYNTNGVLSATNCTFYHNLTDTTIGNENGSMKVINCTFDFNGGGDILNTNGTATLINSTFAQNVVSVASADIVNYGLHPLTAINCTCVSNYNNGFYANGSTLNLTNCLIANPPSGSSQYYDVYSNAVVHGAGNVIGVANLNLAPLGDYGGSVQTLLPLPGSPAIDAGSDSVTNFLATDERGMPRLAGTHVDAGAVEFGYSLVVRETADPFLPEYTLRAAVAEAPPGATITFAPALDGSTIYVTNGEIVLGTNVTIDATALPDGIVVSGAGMNRVFQVSAGATVTLNGLTLTGGSIGLGGEQIANNGDLTLNNCTLTNSPPPDDCIYSESSLALNNCTVANNGGAGITCGDCNLTLDNCSLTGNSGPGAVLFGPNSLTVNNCTIVGNSSSGISCYGGGGTNYAILNLTNSIVTDNSGGNLSTSDCVLNEADNLVDTANIALAPLGNYGGRTPTMPPLPGSPAIDAGADSVTNFLATDQRGLPRLSGAHVDVGAAEVQFVAANPGNPPALTNPLWSSASGSGGTFQFAFTNVSGADFTALTATSVAVPLANWTVLGNIPETSPGVYQFTDPGATNSPQRFYRVVSP
jgi:Right handed beta helix region